MNGARHYMRKYGTEDDASVPVMDLEADFSGLFYLEAAGLSSKGTPKNIYYETYAESDETRVHIPKKICREYTEVTIRFAFIGKGCRDVYDRFYDYVKLGKIRYWDTARNREARIVLSNAVEVEEDVLKGGEPYMIADFKFRNLFGETFPVDAAEEEA